MILHIVLQFKTIMKHDLLYLRLTRNERITFSFQKKMQRQLCFKRVNRKYYVMSGQLRIMKHNFFFA